VPTAKDFENLAETQGHLRYHRLHPASPAGVSELTQRRFAVSKAVVHPARMTYFEGGHKLAKSSRSTRSQIVEVTPIRRCLSRQGMGIGQGAAGVIGAASGLRRTAVHPSRPLSLRAGNGSSCPKAGLRSLRQGYLPSTARKLCH